MLTTINRIILFFILNENVSLYYTILVIMILYIFCISEVKYIQHVILKTVLISYS